MTIDINDIVYRLRKRAEIRRQISSRKSVQEGKPDRIADLLEEAASEIMLLRNKSFTGTNIKMDNEVLEYCPHCKAELIPYLPFKRYKAGSGPDNVIETHLVCDNCGYMQIITSTIISITEKR